jgi:hypothetical protein
MPLRYRNIEQDAAQAKREQRRRQEKDLEKALEDTFPASDPASVTQPGSTGNGGEQHYRMSRRKPAPDLIGGGSGSPIKNMRKHNESTTRPACHGSRSDPL